MRTDPAGGEPLPFADRREVGARLARRLSSLRGTDALLLALPRGGVPVAEVIARELRLPLDLLVVRKVGAPAEPEYGLGSVTEFGDVHLDLPRVRAAGYTRADLEPVVRREQEEAARRSRLYRRGGPPPEVAGRTVVLVDDGVATGGTLEGACRSMRSRGARRIVVAIGVGPAETVDRLRSLADEVVCLATPEEFFAVGGFYRDFEPVDDQEVLSCLGRARSGERAPTGA